MTVALILLAALVAVGLLLYAEHRIHLARKSSDDLPTSLDDKSRESAGDECCGLHITCEKDSLLASVSARIEYYDDEELDRFAGTDSEAYTDSEIEEFRDILLSMRPDDIAGWARSLQLRGITLPQSVRDELIMIVAEERSARTPHATIPAV